jgi:hypothetical protein
VRVNSELPLEDRIKNLQRRLMVSGYHDPSYIGYNKLLLIASAGSDVWNAWFERQPPRSTLDFYGSDFNRHPIDFSGFIFRAPMDNSACVSFRKVRLDSANKFSSVVFESQAIFKEASFGPDADFSLAVFAAKADFSDTKFGDNASFKAAKFRGDAIFSGCTFSDMSSFSEADFNATASFQSKWLGHRITFERAHFQGRAEFHATFGNLAIFRKARFRDVVTFKSAKFGMSCAFEETEFDGHADFENAKFSKSADFNASRFRSYADFNRSNFEERASFSSVEFESPALFEHSNFGDDANFTSSKFQDRADFKSAAFEDRPRFESAKILGIANFHAVTLGDDANFEGMEFSRSADFSSSIRLDAGNGTQEFQAISFAGTTFFGDITFEGRRFKSTTCFGRPGSATSGILAATFDGIPNFHGCELHQDTDFHGTTFREHFDENRGPDAARAYRTLKLAMEKSKATREEQRFFRLEMKAEHPSLPRGKRWISTLYELFSDYGFSLWRPAVWLFGLSMLFGIGYGALANACATNTECSKIAWAGNTGSSKDRTSAVIKYTLASIAPVPGLDKMQTELRAPIFGHHGWIPITALILEILHKIAALVMAFLFALALRNLFKMKS